MGSNDSGGKDLEVDLVTVYAEDAGERLSRAIRLLLDAAAGKSGDNAGSVGTPETAKRLERSMEPDGEPASESGRE